MKLKTFDILFALENPNPKKFDAEVNRWLAENEGIKVQHRDFHTRSGLNTLQQPYTYFTLMLWYEETKKPSDRMEA